MTDETGVLQNDPNRGLRDRIDPGDGSPRDAQDTLIIALHDLHEAARERLAVPERSRRGRKSRHRARHR
jgi:hypothetical protein